MPHARSFLADIEDEKEEGNKRQNFRRNKGLQVGVQQPSLLDKVWENVVSAATSPVVTNSLKLVRDISVEIASNVLQDQLEGVRPLRLRNSFEFNSGNQLAEGEYLAIDPEL